MTNEISELLDAAARHTVPVVRGVRDDQLEVPTPCPEFTVRDLLNHLCQVVVNFQGLAAREDVDWAATPDCVGELWAEKWRDRFAEETRRLIEAWERPGATEGTAGAMDLPARTVGTMAAIDLVVHGWDLAVATGQDYAPAEAPVHAAGEFLRETGDTGRRMGAFGEPVPAPEGATGFERVLAASGRDPRWKPAA